MIRKRGLDAARTLRCALLALACACVCSLPAYTQARHASEYEVKAAYLFNFGQFVSWKHASAQPRFSVCVLGADPFGNVLEATIDGANVDGKSVAIKRIVETPAEDECQILFVSSSEAGRLSKVLKDVEHSGAVTVSDAPNFCSSGGMIEFVDVGGKIRFTVNVSAARASGISISGQMLKLALNVIDQEPRRGG